MRIDLTRAILMPRFSNFPRNTNINFRMCLYLVTPQNEVILRNEVVQRVNKGKFLGVIVDQHLNWKDHISMISQKNFKSCGIIYRIRNTL